MIQNPAMEVDYENPEINRKKTSKKKGKIMKN